MNKQDINDQFLPPTNTEEDSMKLLDICSRLTLREFVRSTCTCFLIATYAFKEYGLYLDNRVFILVSKQTNTLLTNENPEEKIIIRNK